MHQFHLKHSKAQYGRYPQSLSHIIVIHISSVEYDRVGTIFGGSPDALLVACVNAGLCQFFTVYEMCANGGTLDFAKYVPLTTKMSYESSGDQRKWGDVRRACFGHDLIVFCDLLKRWGRKDEQSRRD